MAAAQQVHSAVETPAGGAGNGWLGWGAAGFGAAALGAGAHVALAEDEAEHGLHAPSYPWPHEGLFSSYDHTAIRRGYQVYQQVSATKRTIVGRLGCTRAEHEVT